MQLLFKQLTRELFKNKSFVGVLSLFIIFTSFMYFFVHFSIDYNLTILNQLIASGATFSADESKYLIALEANSILIRNISLGFVSILLVILCMFFKNFIRKNETQLGQMMTLGFCATDLSLLLALFMTCLSFISTIIGLAGGYVGSSLLISANQVTYSVDSLQKGVYFSTFLKGTLGLTLIITLTTYLTCLEIGKKEVGLKIKKSKQIKQSKYVNRLVDMIIKYLPEKSRFRMRLTLRNISALSLLLVAIISFNIFFILGVSLYFTGPTVYQTQILNHNYQYDLGYNTPLVKDQSHQNDDIFYLTYDGEIVLGNNTLSYSFMSLDQTNDLFKLVDPKGTPISSNDSGIILNKELQENYNVQIGDMLTLTIEGTSYTLEVIAIAENAQLRTLYVPQQFLADALGIDHASYNGLLSNTNYPADYSITQHERLTALERDVHSNQKSSIINQAVGVVVGCLLIYLAVFIIFNNSTENILVFDLLGYTPEEINRIILNPFCIILNSLFLLTLYPSIYIAKKIQIMTAIQISEYLPFQLNFITVIYLLVVINIIHLVVRTIFVWCIRRSMTKELHTQLLA